MSDTICLGCMDRDDLHRMMFALQQVQRAVMELEPIGGPASISMLPGDKIRISVANPIGADVMPWASVNFAPAPAEMVIRVGIEPETPEFTDPAPPVFSPGDEERAACDGDQAGAVAGEETEPGTPADDAAPAGAEPVELGGGLPPFPAAQPELEQPEPGTPDAAAMTAEGAEPVMPGGVVGNAAGHHPTAEDEAHGGRPPRWTDAENATALKIVVDAVLAGGAASSAGQAVAEATGRPVAGVQFRIKTVWRDEIAVAVAKAREAQLAAVPDDDLTRHLRSVPRKGWPIKDDLDLVKFAFDGWGVSEMRLELKRDEKAIKDRRRVLTGDNRYKLKDVLARLEAMQAEAA